VEIRQFIIQFSFQSSTPVSAVTAFGRVKSKPVCSLCSPRLTSGCKLRMVRMELSVCRERVPEAIKIPIMQQRPTDCYIIFLPSLFGKQTFTSRRMEERAITKAEKCALVCARMRVCPYVRNENITKSMNVYPLKMRCPHGVSQSEFPTQPRLLQSRFALRAARRCYAHHRRSLG